MTLTQAREVYKGRNTLWVQLDIKSRVEVIKIYARLSRNTLWVQLDIKKEALQEASETFGPSRNTLWVQLDIKPDSAADLKNWFYFLSQYSMSAIRY